MAAVIESACDLRVGQVGVATLKLRRLDIDDIRAELTSKVAAAPQLLTRAPVIVDLNAFSDLPDHEKVRELLTAIRDSGVLPVGLTYGSGAVDALARDLDLPLFSRFRASYEHDEPAPSVPTPASNTTQTAAPAIATAPAAVTAPGGIRLHEGHVRSGQQIYARGQDLTIIGTVSTGAEVIADGNVHIYGALRGRALAGASGDAKARVFCSEFRAELVAVAGNYRVLDDAPANLHGKPLAIRLDGERLVFDPL